MGTQAREAVLSVIPTYRPSRHLIDLIDNLSPQVATVVVSDDGSPCTFDSLLRLSSNRSKVTVIRHGSNAGIARGLNDGLTAAHGAGIPWLLTIDQDSDVSSDYVEGIVDQANRRLRAGARLGAIGALSIADAAGELTYPTRTTPHGPITEELIQTGTLWSVSALTEIGGFDESLGIDAVDAAACLRLRERGFSIAIAPGLSIRHSIGEARLVPFLGRKVMVTGHSPARRTSMMRNRLRLFPAEFRQSPRHAVRTIRRVVTNQALGLVLESDRGPKAKASLKGLLPGAAPKKV